MSVLSFGVSSVPLYLKLPILCSCLDNGFQVFTKRFPKDNDVFKGFSQTIVVL
jgi:hypothetical protein